MPTHGGTLERKAVLTNGELRKILEVRYSLKPFVALGGVSRSDWRRKLAWRRPTCTVVFEEAGFRSPQEDD